MSFVCPNDRVQRALVCVCGKMRTFAEVHVGDGEEEEEGGDEGRWWILFVKRSLASSAPVRVRSVSFKRSRCGKSSDEEADRTHQSPGCCREPPSGPSPARIGPWSLGRQSGFIPRKCGAASAAAETAGGGFFSLICARSGDAHALLRRVSARLIWAPARMQMSLK